jgi:hypothetical protein
MKNIIPQYSKEYRSAMEWYRPHSSGLFTMQIKVHSENISEDRSPHTSPRCWNTYLLGGETGRWYKEGKPERWIEKNPLTDLVMESGQNTFDPLDWNGGVTLFDVKKQEGGTHPGLIIWKVGDDFQHLWDMERWDYYDFNYMMNHIEHIGDQLVAMLKLRGIEAKKEGAQ